MTVVPSVHAYARDLCGAGHTVDAADDRRRELPGGWLELPVRQDARFKHLCADCLVSVDCARRPKESDADEDGGEG